jgi:hypothetical protein
MTTKGSPLVVLGMMGRMPLAGVAWQLLHYLAGFRRLGFDVYYVEDTRTWSYDPDRNTVTDDCGYAVNFISEIMSSYGFSGRWAYRAGIPGNRTFGLSDSELSQLFKRANVLVNVTGATRLRSEHLHVPVRIYLETDPVLPQIEIAKNNMLYIGLLEAHTHHFTFGENIGAPSCGVPLKKFHYRPTRQPIVVDWWRSATSAPAYGASCFTTIANWRQSGKDIEWKGKTYTWSKHHEFLKFIDLPRRTAQQIELALALESGNGNADRAWATLNPEDAEAIRILTEHGWRTVNAVSMSKKILPYRDYICSSRGEFTVAKDQNVRLRSGWFSDRSACYLAAGRPVITQDTGIGQFLPTGEGLFAFNTMEEILAAFEAINSDYEKHSLAARAIAEEYFRAETVLAKVLTDLGL